MQRIACTKGCVGATAKVSCGSRNFTSSPPRNVWINLPGPWKNMSWKKVDPNWVIDPTRVSSGEICVVTWTVTRTHSPPNRARSNATAISGPRTSRSSLRYRTKVMIHSRPS
jgi:hypothetical protein